VPALGLKLRDITLSGRSEGGRQLALDGSARSGSGTMTVHGTANLAPGGRPTATLRIGGQKVQAANTDDLVLVVTPDLEARLLGNDVDVTGSLVVPEGRIEIESRGENMVVRPTRDEVVVGEPVVTRAGATVGGRVLVTLEKDLLLDAFGLRGNPTGTIMVVKTGNRSPTGSGVLTLEKGVYRAYGQELAVERGRLVFAGGPVDNPGIDLRASRTASDGVVAGFQVSGTVRAPRLEVFSTPAMGESEALSYVIFGRPIDRINPSESNLITSAATAFGLEESNELTDKIASELDLEQASLVTRGPLEETALQLGKYLSPKLFVNYSVGLFDAESRVRMQYFLHRRWTAQVEAGKESSGEILYTIER
jgi:translocation and assembly module TamB